MALFGFGKKKTDSEVQKAPDDAAERLQRAKEKASSVMSRKPKPGLAAPAADNSRKVRKSTENKLIGQLLMKDSKISQQQLNKALNIQKEKGGVLGQILTGMQACSKADVAAALKKQRTITTVDPTTLQFDKEALALLARDFCEKNRLIPFELAGNQLCVAMSNALDTMAKNEVKDLTQMHIKIFDAAHEGIQDAIRKQYSASASAPAAPSLAEAARQEMAPKAEDIVIELPEEELTLAEEEPARPAQPAPAPLADLPVIEEIQPEDEAPAEELLLVEEEPAPAPAPAPVVRGVPVVAAAPAAAVAPAEHEMHGGDIPSVGDLDALDVSLIQECARTLWSGQGLKAIPLPRPLADEIIEEGSVDLLRLWMAEHEGRLAVPVCLPL